jgi:hypothetical protein
MWNEFIWNEHRIYLDSIWILCGIHVSKYLIYVIKHIPCRFHGIYPFYMDSTWIPHGMWGHGKVLLHPYYKLVYIKVSWGGAKEQAVEIAAGNLKVKNWHDEANKVVENMVRFTIPFDMSYHTNATK